MSEWTKDFEPKKDRVHTRSDLCLLCRSVHMAEPSQALVSSFVKQNNSYLVASAWKLGLLLYISHLGFNTKSNCVIEAELLNLSELNCSFLLSQRGSTRSKARSCEQSPFSTLLVTGVINASLCLPAPCLPLPS